MSLEQQQIAVSPNENRDIFSYWPMKSDPRTSQVTVLDWVSKLPPHIKYILCEMPVGGGKSPLALTLSGWFSKTAGNAYILTPQKVLQKQYEDSFDRKLLHTLYGKSNYKCESKKTNCEVGALIRPRCASCPHQDAFAMVKYAPSVVLNYSLALLLFKYQLDESIIKNIKQYFFIKFHVGINSFCCCIII